MGFRAYHNTTLLWIRLSIPGLDGTRQPLHWICPRCSFKQINEALARDFHRRWKSKSQFPFLFRADNMGESKGCCRGRVSPDVVGSPLIGGLCRKSSILMIGLSGSSRRWGPSSRLGPCFVFCLPLSLLLIR